MLIRPNPGQTNLLAFGLACDFTKPEPKVGLSGQEAKLPSQSRHITTSKSWVQILEFNQLLDFTLNKDWIEDVGAKELLTNLLNLRLH